MAKANERDKFKYGVCTNHDLEGKPCPKCENKEIQQIRMGQDFICEECKEPLRPVPPPKKKGSNKLISIIAAIVVIGGAIGGYLAIQGGDDPLSKKTEPEITAETSVVVENVVEEKSVKAAETQDKKTEKEEVKTSLRTPNPTFPCGEYDGKTSNGEPHGMGTFTYRSRTLIDDHKMVYAERGDYITGTFREGKIISVHLYDSGGNLKQTVIPQQPTSICR